MPIAIQMCGPKERAILYRKSAITNAKTGWDYKVGIVGRLSTRKT